MISHHSVEAVVNVTVKEIPEEAVDKSGSIRFVGVTAEDFVSPNEVIVFSSVCQLDMFVITNSVFNYVLNFFFKSIAAWHKQTRIAS